jgi:hypothetical protein
LKNDGFFPSILWPINCPIQAATNIDKEVCHNGNGKAMDNHTLPIIHAMANNDIPMANGNDNLK